MKLFNVKGFENLDTKDPIYIKTLQNITIYSEDPKTSINDFILPVRTLGPPTNLLQGEFSDNSDITNRGEVPFLAEARFPVKHFKKLNVFKENDYDAIVFLAITCLKENDDKEHTEHVKLLAFEETEGDIIWGSKGSYHYLLSGEDSLNKYKSPIDGSKPFDLESVEYDSDIEDHERIFEFNDSPLGDNGKGNLNDLIFSKDQDFSFIKRETDFLGTIFKKSDLRKYIKGEDIETTYISFFPVLHKVKATDTDEQSGEEVQPARDYITLMMATFNIKEGEVVNFRPRCTKRRGWPKFWRENWYHGITNISS